MSNQDTLTDRIIIIIFVLWVLGHVVAMTDRSFRMPDSLNLAMSGVLAYLLGSKGIKKARKKDASPNETGEEKSE